MATRPTTFIPYTFSHPNLGDLKGRLASEDTPSVVDFRSIPYATVPQRFRPSILLDHIPEQFDHRPHQDFTVRGTACPQIPAGTDHQYRPFGGPLSDDLPLPLQYDDMTVTTLSLAVPKAALESGTSLSKLPVMVYIHGGGLAEGIGHVNGKQNLRRLVEFSIEENMPVIGITIGYRLNWFGFLTCQDLLEEATGRRPDDSEVFNMGLHDQRKAFLWIKKFISGFGGDRNNITAFGESAGSTSLTYHLCGDAPLFNRAILQSCGVWGSSTLAEKEMFYQSLLKKCGITATTGSERLAALRAYDPLALGKIGPPVTHMLPYFGEDTAFYSRGLPNFTNQFELVKSCPWIDSLVVGADHFEGHALLQYLTHASPAKTIDIVRNALGGDDLAGKLMKEYDLYDGMPQVLLHLNLAILEGDMWLVEPIHRMADIVSHDPNKKVYRYTFCLTNPWPGTDCSFVTGHHYIELFFIFLTLLERFPKGRNRFLEKQAKETARRWITFANAKEPWARYEGTKKISAVCDDRVGWEERTMEQDRIVSEDDPWGKRRYEGIELLKAVWEKMGGEKTERARRVLIDIAKFVEGGP